MNIDHDRMQELLHAYVDGELDLVSGQELEQHLRTCEDCRRVEEQIRALSNALTSDAPAYRAPAHLRKNVRAALRREAKESQISWPWLVFATGATCAVLFLAAAAIVTAVVAATFRVFGAAAGTLLRCRTIKSSAADTMSIMRS